MAKILQFRAKATPPDKDAVKLLLIADEIDAIIVEAMTNRGIEPRDIAAVLAHRLGTLVRNVDQKSELLDICASVAKTQAAVE